MKLEDLQKFCSNDESRTGITQPFTWDSYTFATDGKIMVRVPKVEGVLEGGNAGRYSTQPRLYECNHIIENGEPHLLLSLPPNWRDIPDKTVPCPTCRGKKKGSECSECEGEGEIECDHCGHESECKNCDGTGFFGDTEGENCERCNGLGVVKTHTPVSINRGEAWSAKELIEKAYSLPGAKVYYRPDVNNFYFAFNGGAGCFMPMTSPDNWNEITRDQWRGV
jgi:hypothetical protein